MGYLYPQVQQANGSVNYTSASKNAANTKAGDLDFWEYNVGVSVGWELDFWGKFRRSIEAADANLLASVAGYDNALVLLVAQVADTYVAIRTAEAQLKVARENVALQQRSVRITEARFRGGDVGELDVLQARTQLLGTQATIPPLETGLQQARNALSTLLGRPPGSLEEILGPQPGVIPAAPPAIAAGAPTDLLRRRPDVRQAELAAAAQSAVVGVAEADLYPSFGLSGFLGVVAADGTNTTRTGNSGFGQLFNANSLDVLRRAVLQLEHPELRTHPQQRPGQGCPAPATAGELPEHRAQRGEGGGGRHGGVPAQPRAGADSGRDRSVCATLARHRQRRVPRRLFRLPARAGRPERVAAGAAASRRGAQHDRQQRDRDLSGARRRLGDPFGPGIRGRRRPGTPCKSAWTGAICCNRKRPSRR